ncbi:putative hydrolase of the HAD superfamily [Pseudoxanthomonas sp. GM95]|uniref:HAD-IA family hydrolase n=1 Tax=Pseudoxanthomonas sp. GM95 TaxID=1881043 RepID=UPI0008C90DCB|nr:HAD-IA family hydrolase [Pseudoxanthomonas sp. GM95]SEK53420.1 putative hydrolase of the HAD superfamily [Pseudoxanthomonas sp. GM95]
MNRLERPRLRPPALVLFDLDDVLARYERRVRLVELAHRSGTSPAAVQAALFDSGLEHESDIGLWRPEDYADELSRRLGARLTLADCIAARTVAVQADPAMVALAREVARHAQVAIFTNNGPFLTLHLEQICPALFPLFAGRVVGAGDVGIAKPSPQAYLRALALLDAAPADTLFIDDRDENVSGARAAGLDAVGFSSADTLARVFDFYHLTGN